MGPELAAVAAEVGGEMEPAPVADELRGFVAAQASSRTAAEATAGARRFTEQVCF
jgi:hypothetical protein